MEFFGKVEFRRHGGASASWVGRWAVLGGRVDMWVGRWAGSRVGGWVGGWGRCGRRVRDSYIRPSHRPDRLIRVGSRAFSRLISVCCPGPSIRVGSSESDMRGACFVSSKPCRRAPASRPRARCGRVVASGSSGPGGPNRADQPKIPNRSSSVRRERTGFRPGYGFKEHEARSMAESMRREARLRDSARSAHSSRSSSE